MLQPRDEDVRLFDEDPIEYIRKGGKAGNRETTQPEAHPHPSTA